MFSYIFRDIRPCSPVKYIDFSIALVASIFRVEGTIKQELSKKQAERKAELSSSTLQM